MVGIDRHHLDSLSGIVFCQLNNPLLIALGCWTVVAGKNDGQYPVVLKRLKRVRFSINCRETKAGRLRTYRKCFRAALAPCRNDNTKYSQKEREKAFVYRCHAKEKLNFFDNNL